MSTIKHTTSPYNFHRHHHHHDSKSRKASYFASYSKHNFFSIWVKILKLSFAFSFIISIFNLGSSIKLQVVPIKSDYVPNMILNLPMFCKYSVMQACSFVYENSARLMTLMPLAERKYVPDDTPLHHETTAEHPGEKPKGDDPHQQRYRQQQQQQHGRLTKYVRSLKWTPIPLGVGFAFLAYQHYRRVIRRASDPASRTGGAHLAKNWEVTCYRMVPLRAFSRAWGWVHSINLPVWARTPLYTWYAEAFNCNVGEAEIEDLQYYRNLGEFFRRGLKTGVRPICSRSAVVSPVDGTVLHCGKVECGNVEQVKGVSYSLPTFLGPQTWRNGNNNDEGINQTAEKEQYCSGLLKNKGTALFHCVIYLAPGDYHRFHSPVEWNVQFRRHFAGELLSVNPVVARWIAGLFSLNERAVYVGEWEHGFFSYTAVGATNVGSIRVYEDKDLTTNCWRLQKNTFIDKKFSKPIPLQKGDNFGEFNLGSTIVLLFEAPLDFEFAAENGSKIHLGESLFKCMSPPPPSTSQNDENPSL